MSRALFLGLLPSVVACSTATTPLLELRMTPAEMSTASASDHAPGSSGLSGVHTKVIAGDPAKAGFYTILLFVPAGTTIQAHSQRDDRVAAVVSGEWNFGYGDHFDERSLKRLPAGSVYSEPGGKTHFAKTTASPVVVEISGYGPTNTAYFEPANDPSQESRIASLAHE